MPMPARHRGRPALTEPAPNGKVAIPRIRQRENPNATAAHDKSRVINACTNCRKKKVKCNGERPKCKHCAGHKAPCEYIAGRKDRLKIATEQNTELIELLKDISSRAGDDDQHAIRRLLRNMSSTDNIPVDTSSMQKNAYGKRSRTGSDGSPQSDADADAAGRQATDAIGSRGVIRQDLQREDLLRTRESRSTGYVGQNSDVQWLRNLRSHSKDLKSEKSIDTYTTASEHPTSPKQSGNAPGPRQSTFDYVLPVTNSSYYLDSDSIDVDGTADAYELPPTEIADRLFDCFMKTVHASFPVLPRSFEAQFREYYHALRRREPFRVQDTWQAILNLVFAIGARYSHLINADWQADRLDHLTYLCRALRLLEGHTIATLVAPPDLLSIQATSLLAIYYLAIGHVSRAWITIGSAIRFALTVGLHLRNDDPRTPSHRKETLTRIWWGLHSIESLLSAITGRPDVISDKNCTVPLPTHFPEEQSTASSPQGEMESMKPSGSLSSASSMSPMSSGSKQSTPSPPIPGSFLDARVRISRLTQKVLLMLYSPRATSKPWGRVRSLVSDLMGELDDWAFVAIPDKLPDFNTRKVESDYQREQLLLRFHYYSTKLLISRPCLCRIEHRQPGPNSESTALDQKTAEACVQAAMGMCMLLPDEPDPKYIYRNGPWWSMVHHIMQALAVLLLEISYRRTYGQRDDTGLSEGVQKLISWLYSMRSTNTIANRAFNVISDIVKKGSPASFGHIAQRLPSNETVPITETTNNFNHPYLQNTLEIPAEPATRFQPNEWDPIEWQYLDTQPQQLPPATPFVMSPVQPQGRTYSPNSIMEPVFLVPDPQSPTYGHPFVANFDRLSTG